MDPEETGPDDEAQYLSQLSQARQQSRQGMAKSQASQATKKIAGQATKQMAKMALRITGQFVIWIIGAIVGFFGWWIAIGLLIVIILIATCNAGYGIGLICSLIGL